MLWVLFMILLGQAGSLQSCSCWCHTVRVSTAEAFSRSPLAANTFQVQGKPTVLGWERQDFQNLHESHPALLHFVFNMGGRDWGWGHLCRGDVQMEFGPELTDQQGVFLCIFVYFCAKVVPCNQSLREFFWSLCMDGNPTIVISTQLGCQNLYKTSLWVFRPMSSYLCILHMDFLLLEGRTNLCCFVLWPYLSQWYHPLITLPNWHKGEGKT